MNMTRRLPVWLLACLAPFVAHGATTLHDTAIGTDDNTNTSVSTADALAVTAGDLVVAGFKCEDAMPSGVTVVIDTGASTPAFTLAYPLTAHSGNNELCGAVGYWIATSTTTVTVRATTSNTRSFKILKAYSFTPTAGQTFAYDTGAQNPQATTTAASSGAASATASGVAVGFFPAYGSINLTPGTGWAEAAEFNLTDSQPSEYRFPTGAGSITADGTVGAQELLSTLVIFKEISAGGGGSNAPRAIHHLSQQVGQ